MIKKIIPGLICLIMLLVANMALAVEGTHSGLKLDKTLTKRANKYLDVNSIRCVVMNNGTFSRNPSSGNSDMEWPKGTGKYICYNAGIWVAGKVNDIIRTACSDYNVEFQPGVILPDGTADNPENSEYRVYKVHREFKDGTTQGTPSLDIDSWADWETYAMAQGAPPVQDADGNWIGFGDEMLYAVMNDLDQNLHSGCYNTLPIGIELHLLVFAFDRSGALGNTMFAKYTLINKGTNDLEEAYIGAWADVDNGDANDDLIGFDLERGMSYCYGGKPIDATYGTRPPALGWDYFQGPIIESPGDTVKLPDGRIYPNSAIIGATSFNKYYNSHAIYSDPDYSAQGALEVWNYLAGFQKDGTPWVNPVTGEESKVLNTGDPVTGEGWLSTEENAPDDIRMLTGSGPFTLAVGDTQEIVLGCVIGQGSNRLSSVEVLRFYDQEAQQAYDLGFNVPPPPPPPNLTISELDRKVLVTWEKNAESFTSDYHQFEGYNVYIGDSPGGPWKRLATYDEVNDLDIILQPTYDTNTGLILDLPAAYGNNLGLAYRYLFEKDYDDLTMANGRTYYIAITSYAYGPNSLPSVLESRYDIYYITPHQGRPGDVVSYDALAEVPVEHTVGNADTSKWEVYVQIVDPLNVETANYEVSVNADESWTLWKNGTAVPGYTDRTDYGIDKNNEYLTLEDNEIDFFFGITASFYLEKVTSWESELITGDSTLVNNLVSPADEGKATALAIDGPYKKGTRSEEYIYNALQIRFTGTVDDQGKVVSGGSKSTLLYGYGDPAFFVANHPENPNPGSRTPFTVDVPFEIWDTVRGIQLNSAFADYKQKLSDADFVPTWAPRGRCLVIAIASAYDTEAHNCSNLFGGTDTLGIWTFIYEDSTLWNTGDVVQLNIPDPELIPKPVVPGVDKFAFSIKGKVTGDLEDAKKRLDIMNVYPNPYFAHTISETQLHEEHVTFINLPEKCTIRIFTISGQLVKKIEFDDPANSTCQWDLRNENFLPVASGFYIAHIDVPNVGEKILKLAIVFRQQRLKNL